MSLCDRCFAPGKCCKELALLNDAFNVPPTAEAAIIVAQEAGLPFIPERRASLPDGSKFWLWSCSNLLPNGRCGDYENRPSVCRNFEPGCDDLCVHSRGTTVEDVSAGMMPPRTHVPDEIILDSEAPW